MSFLKCEACSLLQLIGIAVLIVRWSGCNNSSSSLLRVGGAVVGAEFCAVFTVENTKNPYAFLFFVKQGSTIGFILAIFNHILLVLD